MDSCIYGTQQQLLQRMDGSDGREGREGGGKAGNERKQGRMAVKKCHVVEELWNYLGMSRTWMNMKK